MATDLHIKQRRWPETYATNAQLDCYAGAAGHTGGCLKRIKARPPLHALAVEPRINSQAHLFMHSNMSW